MMTKKKNRISRGIMYTYIGSVDVLGACEHGKWFFSIWNSYTGRVKDLCAYIGESQRVPTGW